MNDPSAPVGWSLTTEGVTADSAAARERYWKSVTVHFRRAGFVYGTAIDNETGYFEHYFEMPFWPLLALALMLPAVKTYQLWRARNRRLAGRCLRCGYDLRASADYCPECGTAIIASPAV